MRPEPQTLSPRQKLLKPFNNWIFGFPEVVKQLDLVEIFRIQWLMSKIHYESVKIRAWIIYPKLWTLKPWDVLNRVGSIGSVCTDWAGSIGSVCTDWAGSVGSVCTELSWVSRVGIYWIELGQYVLNRADGSKLLPCDVCYKKKLKLPLVGKPDKLRSGRDLMFATNYVICWWIVIKGE